MKRLARLAFCAISASLMLGASDTDTLHLKVVAVRSDNGATVEDLTPRDWSIKVDGKEQVLTSQRGPAEISNQAQSWVLVFLPIESPQMRKLALGSALTLMQSLPQGDRVLVVTRNAKGLECLTPGFTALPSHWAKAIRALMNDLPAGLLGNSSEPFVLPEAAAAEPLEGKEGLTALEKELAAAELRRFPQDLGYRPSLHDQYPATSLGGFTESVKRVFNSMELMGDVISRVPGEKQMVIWSRCEVDDLANPQWQQIRNKIPAMNSRLAENNPALQIDLMMKDIKVSREHLKNRFARLGLTVHSVGGTSLNYSGAFSETAIASGGQNFRFEATLPGRLSAVMGSWAAHYELTVSVPSTKEHPHEIALSANRDGVRVIGPILQ